MQNTYLQIYTIYAYFLGIKITKNDMGLSYKNYHKILYKSTQYAITTSKVMFEPQRNCCQNNNNFNKQSCTSTNSIVLYHAVNARHPTGRFAEL